MNGGWGLRGAEVVVVAHDSEPSAALPKQVPLQ